LTETTLILSAAAGAGQEVGKSCVVVTIGGKRVMFDCGMHMGHHDCQRYPDFARILSAAPGAADFTSAISCVVITHLYVGQMFLVPLSPIFFNW
jgi:integrator complex subunit 11